MDPQQTTTTATTSTSTTNHPTTGTADDDGGPKDPTTIVKGKRTKRQRPTIVSHSSTSYNAFNSSPASSSNFPASSTTTEDEDTANCLILLSKGHNISAQNNNNNNNNMEESSGYKFNSKRYIQTSTDALNGPTGMYVYECKTCSRTFASFQALGGHRASHKKPRINEHETRKPLRYAAVSEEDELSPRFESQLESRRNNLSSSSSLSLQINQRMVSYNKKPSSRLHDCSICGAEFNSGQALGGHMRRHRAVNGNTTALSTGVLATNTTLSLVPYGTVTSVVADDHDNQKSMNDGLCLDLDLNLPAPAEMTVAVSDQDQRRESSFKFTANQNKKQPTVHLSSAPTLVDCQY
ncbi:hypothetical protein R6Q59_014529 [Mikania micrantha]